MIKKHIERVDILYIDREVSLNGNVNDFSVDYNSIDKSNILNIHKYLMIKSNKK